MFVVSRGRFETRAKTWGGKTGSDAPRGRASAMRGSEPGITLLR